MPSTLFTEPPHWRWLIVLYFFIGGLAGGCYFLATLIDLFGRATDRPLARLGYLIAFPAVIVCGLLLIVDLNRPERFWHMMLQSETLRPMLKAYSPMSLGAWALLAFGAFAFVSFLAALRPRGAFGVLRPPGVPGTIVSTLGALFGLYLAGYTGVLLSVTNRPLWSDTTLLGAVFLVSSASTSAALLILLSARRGWSSGVQVLRRFDSWLLLLELAALVALVASLGSLARLWLNGWGLLLALGVVGLGIVAPLVMHWRRHAVEGMRPAVAAVLVLIGGFLLRVVIILSSEMA